MFISPAYAQEATGMAGGLEAFLPLILIFVVFYFLLIRPQQKRMKQHKEMLGNIRRGDRIVTNGGIVGQVVRAQDTELQVEIAEGVKVKVMRDMVANVLAKTEPARSEGGAAKGKGRAKEAPRDRDEDEDQETDDEDVRDEAPANDQPAAGKAAGLKGLLSKNR